MIKVKKFFNEESMNAFIGQSNAKVIDVKFQIAERQDVYILVYEELNLKSIPTYKLVAELKKRDGVITHEIAPHISEYSISVKSTETEVVNLLSKEVGPAIILEVID